MMSKRKSEAILEKKYFVEYFYHSDMVLLAIIFTPRKITTQIWIVYNGFCFVFLLAYITKKHHLLTYLGNTWGYNKHHGI